MNNEPRLEMATLKKGSDIFQAPLVLTYVPRWPLIVHLLSACFCLGCSALYHTFGIYGIETSKLLTNLDYGGICILIMGSTYPLLFYVFACQEVFWWRDVFCYSITILNLISFMITTLPQFDKPNFRKFRGILFIICGLCDALPFIYLNYVADPRYLLNESSCVPYLFGGVLYIGGACFFIARFPERCFPAKFDLIGASHQIFHVAVVAGCYTHVNEAFNLFIWRK